MNSLDEKTINTIALNIFDIDKEEDILKYILSWYKTYDIQGEKDNVWGMWLIKRDGKSWRWIKKVNWNCIRNEE